MAEHAAELMRQESPTLAFIVMDTRQLWLGATRQVEANLSQNKGWPTSRMVE